MLFLSLFLPRWSLLPFCLSFLSCYFTLFPLVTPLFFLSYFMLLFRPSQAPWPEMRRCAPLLSACPKLCILPLFFVSILYLQFFSSFTFLASLLSVRHSRHLLFFLFASFYVCFPYVMFLLSLVFSWFVRISFVFIVFLLSALFSTSPFLSFYRNLICIVCLVLFLLLCWSFSFFFCHICFHYSFRIIHCFISTSLCPLF